MSRSTPASARVARRRTRAATATAAALIAAAAFAAPSQAAVTSGGQVEVFHGIDFIGLSGYPANTNLRVEVIPAGATDPISFVDAETDSTGLLEINHTGVGDCFSNGGAPDIIPGDQIRVSDGGTIDDLSVVRDVMLTEVAGTGGFVDVDPVAGTITVRGWARDPATLAGLDNIEVRLNHPSGTWDAPGANGRKDWRLAPTPDPATGAYTAVFEDASAADLAAAPDAEVAAEWLGSSELTIFDGFGSACATDAVRNTVIPPPFVPTARPVVTPTNPVAPTAQPTVITNTIVRTIPATPTATVLGTQASRALRVSNLRLARRVSRARLRARGLQVSMTVPQGANVLRVAVYKARNGQKRGSALFRTSRSPSAGAYRLILRNASLLRKLRAGSYLVEVRVGRTAASLGTARRVTFTVTR